MTKPDGPLVAECATWLSIVSQLFGTRMSQLLKPHGLTLGQFSILQHITRQKSGTGSRISEIAAAVEVGQPAVTKAVAKFQNMGLVEISASALDGRSRMVAAKPAAPALLGEIYKDIGPELLKTFSALDPEAIGDFARQLKVLGTWLDKNRLSS